jgi:hypothetical protein
MMQSMFRGFKISVRASFQNVGQGVILQRVVNPAQFAPIGNRRQVTNLPHSKNAPPRANSLSPAHLTKRHNRRAT